MLKIDTAMLWESCSYETDKLVFQSMSVSIMYSLRNNYINKLTMSKSSKLTIFGTVILWESCSKYENKKLLHSMSLPNMYSLGDIDFVSLYI